MTTDEKGYFVTEMVWEEVTDDESTPAIAVKPADKENTANTFQSSQKSTSKPLDKPKPAATAKPKGSTTGSQQKNMMSFFSKK